MSLDVYLSRPGITTTIAGPRIFIRENGATKEISREEWDQRFPDREPYTVNDTEETDEVYSRNITHNLNRMAEAAGLYIALWRPGELLAPEIAQKIRAAEEVGNYHDADGVCEPEQSLPTVTGGDLIGALEAGLLLLESDPERFKVFNPENGWGDYEGLIAFVTDYLRACKEYPDAVVTVSR
jgi:hypothetical protein